VFGELKNKKRYILCRVRSSSSSIDAAILYSAIMNKTLELYGWSGKAITGLRVWQLKDRQGHFVLRCSLRGLPHVLTSTTLLTSINHERVAIDVLRISGTIKSLLG